MSKVKDAYFAGLFDGEATIGAYRHGDLPYLRASIGLCMTDESTIKAVADYFGGACLPKKVYRNMKPQWRWCADATKALTVIRRIRPYLITKAAAADFALNACEERARGRPRKA